MSNRTHSPLDLLGGGEHLLLERFASVVVHLYVFPRGDHLEEDPVATRALFLDSSVILAFCDVHE